jgi:signal transduction histidine kinase
MTMTNAKEMTRLIVKKMLLVYLLLFPVFVVFTLLFNHVAKYNFAKELSFSQRNNLFIKDFRNVNTTLQALSSKYSRIDFFTNNEVQFTSINQDQPKWFYKKIQVYLYTDPSEKNILGYFIFYYNYLESIAYAALAWIICILFLYPSYLVQKNLFLRNLKISKLEVYQDIARQVAHDLKSPLHALETIVVNPEDLKKSHKQIHNVIKRIADISQDLLKKYDGEQIKSTISKSITINDSKRTSAFTSFNLSFQEILNKKDLLGVIQQILQEKKIVFSDINFEFENFLQDDFSFYFSRIELERLFSNLLNNSIEAIQEKLSTDDSIKSDPKIQVTLLISDTDLVIRIFDTGKGIEKEKLNFIFEKGISYKIENQNNNGLGLYHAKKMIDAANGKIKIFSEVNQFTTVEIEIPLNF